MRVRLREISKQPPGFRLDVFGKQPDRVRVPEQAMDDVRVPAYENFPGGAPRIRLNVAAVYDELKSRPQ